jgi:hypothetical protein
MSVTGSNTKKARNRRKGFGSGQDLNNRSVGMHAEKSAARISRIRPAGLRHGGQFI